ncbi:prefoldin subunit 6 [Cricetulus griseus]
MRTKRQVWAPNPGQNAASGAVSVPACLVYFRVRLDSGHNVRRLGVWLAGGFGVLLSPPASQGCLLDEEELRSLEELPADAQGREGGAGAFLCSLESPRAPRPAPEARPPHTAPEARPPHTAPEARPPHRPGGSPSSPPRPAMAELIQKKLQGEVEKYQQLQKDLSKSMSGRQKLEAQLTENNIVKEELALLDGSNVVFKLLGPVLVKQELGEARATVGKRLDYITAEIKRYESQLRDLERQSEQQRETLAQLQQEFQRAQAAKAPGKA